MLKQFQCSQEKQNYQRYLWTSIISEKKSKWVIISLLSSLKIDKRKKNVIWKYQSRNGQSHYISFIQWGNAASTSFHKSTFLVNSFTWAMSSFASSTFESLAIPLTSNCMIPKTSLKTSKSPSTIRLTSSLHHQLKQFLPLIKFTFITRPMNQIYLTEFWFHPCRQQCCHNIPSSKTIFFADKIGFTHDQMSMFITVHY